MEPGLSIELESGRPNAQILDSLGRRVDLDVRTIWNRRRPASYVLPSDAHPADERHIRWNWQDALRGIPRVFEDAFAVNPDVARVGLSNKINQLLRAREIGLNVPPTVITNDYARVCRFIEKYRDVCVKPAQFGGWLLDEGYAYGFTAKIRGVDDLGFDSVTLMPAIYQAYVDKAFEVRVTMFGHFVCGTKIDSQASSRTSIDWRTSLEYFKHCSLIEVPPPVTLLCDRLLRRLGLRFGTFDFAVTPAGEWVFFEVNEAGQFLWQEQFVADCRLLEPFARYLAAASDQFEFHTAGCSEELSFANASRDLYDCDDLRTLMDEPPQDPVYLGMADERSGHTLAPAGVQELSQGQ
jgi:hypothetical protein